MNHRGLCSTCVEVKACIFVKEPPVLECEEFFGGNHQPVFKQGNVKRIIREEITESE